MDTVEPAKVLEAQEATASWWMTPWRFLIHTLTGLFVFATIAAAAVALSLGVDRLEGMKVAPAIILGLRLMEYALFSVDVVLFARFLWRTALRFWYEL